MKLTYNQVREAATLESDGVEYWALGQIFDVHPTTMRRYLRAYHRYGKSFWGRYPTEVNDASDTEQRHQTVEEQPQQARA